MPLQEVCHHFPFTHFPVAELSTQQSAILAYVNEGNTLSLAD